jgi:hypothetical protein
MFFGGVNAVENTFYHAISQISGAKEKYVRNFTQHS